MPSTTNGLSYLDIMNLCGNMRLDSTHSRKPSSEFPVENLVPFHLSDAPNSPVLGMLRPQIVELLRAEYAHGQHIWAGLSPAGPCTKISFAPAVDTHAKRTAAMREMCARWRDAGYFSEIIGPAKWRTELFPVYKDPFGARDHPSASDANPERLNFAFEIERTACTLFGLVTYAVHMNMYQGRRGKEGLRVWTPMRARTKSTWPGYLDNTVGGGIPSGMPVLEALIKECMEEASLDEDLVRAHIRSVGCVSYLHRSADGWLQPEVGYIFDLAIPPGADRGAFEPRPLDGEVESFDFLDKAQLDSALRAGRFKPNCAPVVVDLFIRLGYITPDNEPDFLKIATALHIQFDYKRWALTGKTWDTQVPAKNGNDRDFLSLRSKQLRKKTKVASATGCLEFPPQIERRAERKSAKLHR
ncbi:nudix hydrolase 20 [Mycena latifolia]|nr:nudix hydrolase 20 [Mycena latifolia]